MSNESSCKVSEALFWRAEMLIWLFALMQSWIWNENQQLVESWVSGLGKTSSTFWSTLGNSISYYAIHRKYFLSSNAYFSYDLSPAGDYLFTNTLRKKVPIWKLARLWAPADQLARESRTPRWQARVGEMHTTFIDNACPHTGSQIYLQLFSCK